MLRNAMRVANGITSVLVAMLLASPGHCQDLSAWIGKTVVTKYRTPLMVGDQDKDKGDFRIYTVERSYGELLKLVSQDGTVWVQSIDVVPFDQSIDFYTQEIRKDHRNQSAYSCRGELRLQAGDVDKALVDLTEAIRLDPRDVRAYRSRGAVWSRKREFDKAIADFTEAVRNDPADVRAYRSRGSIWAEKKEYDKALSDFTEAIRLEPKDAQTYCRRAVVWLAKGKSREAENDIKDAGRLDPRVIFVFPSKARRNRASTPALDRCS